MQWRELFMYCGLSLLLSAVAQATDWPHWRGPNREGVAPDSPPLALSWPKTGPQKLWQSRRFRTLRSFAQNKSLPVHCCTPTRQTGSLSLYSYNRIAGLRNALIARGTRFLLR